MTGDVTQNSTLSTRLVRLGAGLALLVSISALAGWALDIPYLASLGQDRIPMAPSTAILFVLVAISVLLRTVRPQRAATFWAGAAINVAGAFAASLLLVLSTMGIHPAIERLWFRTADTLGVTPLGHMSPVTAACFLLMGLSYLLSLPREAGRRAPAALGFWLAAPPTAAGLVFLLAYLLGTPLLYGGSFIPPAASTSVAFVALGAALMALSGAQTWRERVGSAKDKHVSLMFVAVFALLATGIILVGRAYLLGHERHYRAEIEYALSAIADLKVGELARWREERLGDAAVLHGNESFASLVKRVTATPGDPQALELLRGWLGQIQTAYQYDRVCLYDAQGVEQISAPSFAGREAALSSRDAVAAMRFGQVTMRDFYRDESDGRICLAVSVPILDEQGKGPAIGLVLLRIDPSEYLYPLIGYWPTPSQSAETLLVRREGNEAVFLNKLRFREDSALTLRSSLENVTMPAVQAALGHVGIVEGLDYRGIPVIACTRKVAGSPWYLVARMDLAEIHAPLRERLWGMVALVSALLIGAGAGVGLIWRQQRVRFYRERYEVAEALRETEGRYRHLLDNMLEGLQIIGHGWRYVYLNDSAVSSARLPKEALLGNTMLECYPGIETTPVFRVLQRCMEERVPDFVENEFAYPDATSAWFALSIQPVEEGLFILSLNITERKRAEERVQELNRIYAMLSEINQTIVRVREPQALFEKACRIAVEEGGFPLAWIGLLDEDADSFDIVAAHGDTSDYLEKARTLLRSGSAKPCSVGTALHTRQRVVCTLTAQDEDLAECQRLALDHGFQSVASFPLAVSGSYRGAFTLYANAPDFFDDEELALLDEMAMDIGLALELSEKETKRKHAEEALSHEEARRRILFERSMDAIVVLDLQGRVFEANQRFADMLGYSLEEAQTLHVWDWDAQWTREDLMAILEDTSDKLFETRHRRKDGAILDVEVSSAHAHWHGQSLFFCIQRDITWRKQAEVRMREEEERYLRQRDSLIALMGRGASGHGDLLTTLRQITEAGARTLGVARAGLWRYDRGRTSIHCVDLFEVSTGLHSSGVEIAAESYPGYFNALSQSDVIAVEDAVQDPRTCEFAETYLLPLGITSMLDTAVRMRGALEGVLCHEHTGPRRRWTQDEETFALAAANLASLALEESERKRAEESLRIRSAALNAADNAIAIMDVSGAIEWANPAFTALTGYSLDEAIGHNPRELVKSGKHDTAFYAQMWETILDGRVWRGEVVNRRKDGSFYTEEMTITPVRGDSGEVVRFVAIKQDISERKRAEDTLREAEERLRRAVSAGNVGLWDWKVDTNEIVYSAECKLQLGYAEDEIDNEYSEWVERLHPDDRESASQAVERSLANPDAPYVQEFRFQHRDGSYRWILVQGSLLHDEEGKPVRMLGTNVDITERKRLEEQFLQSQKMESIGRLAGGVAHDFNNLLSIINGYADFALESIPEGTPLHEDIQQIRFAGDKAAALTRQLLAFSRKQILQPEIVELEWLLADLEKLLKRLIGEDIELRVISAKDLGRVRADPGQIEQVIINLAVNARDAMPTGGRLTIEATNMELDETFASQHMAVTPGPHVLLSVSDTGTGMDSATQARLFEPFFTTKEMGKGTGLGLATVYGIVKQSGGSIWVYSEVGKGTTFKIYLPRVGEAADAHPETPAGVSGGGNETILLVEDEESLRLMVQRILEDAGYRVIAASHGEEALHLLANSGDHIALALTDVVMPGISGSELTGMLTAIAPTLKILYMSGYTDDAIVHRGALHEDTLFISKPFTAAALTRKVREILDRT